jgi:hypothetical protein
MKAGKLTVNGVLSDRSREPITAFSGTASRSGYNLVFSSEADAILSGYDTTNPVLGTTVVLTANTMHIISWTDSTTAVVDITGTIASDTPTSVQLPISFSVDSDGVLVTAVYANGDTYNNNSNIGTLNSLTLDSTPNVGTHTEGKVLWDQNYHTLAANLPNDVTLQIGQEELRYVYNATGSTIYNGEAVYTNGVYSGADPHVATVALAKSDSSTTSSVLGLATQDILTGNYGYICVRGHVNDLDTNEIGRAFLVNQSLFWSARVGGTAGNSYSITFIKTAGELSYTEETPGTIVIDLGAGTPDNNDIVTLFTNTPSSTMKVKNLFNINPSAQAIQYLANGVETTVGDVLYLSAVDAGFLTTVIQSPPNLKARVGRLITKSDTAGVINVRIIDTPRVSDISDMKITSATDGDIIVYDATTSSWKNVPNTLPTYDAVSDIKTLEGVEDSAVVCIGTSTLYRYVTDGTSPINYGTPDDKYVTITGDGGNTRWVGMMGLYCYAQKSGVFITNQLIAGTSTSATTISGPTTLGALTTSSVLLNVTGSDQEVTLPTAGNSQQGQFLCIGIDTSATYSAIIQTTNTNLSSVFVLNPGVMTLFIFGHTEWHLMGGKSAITQLNQLGVATYRTIQDWNSIFQSAGHITGGLATDDGSGGVDITGVKAIVKTSNSDIGANLFVDIEGTNIPDGSHPTGLEDGINYIYIDYNNGTPIFQVTDDRTSLTRTTQFVVSQLFKDGDDLEIVNLESRISNFARKEVNRLIEVYGVTRVSGADVSESSTRYLQTDEGVMYYGLERIVTPGKDTYTGDSFDLFFRDGSGGWNEIGGETVIDRLRYDNDATPVEVGSGVKGITNVSGTLIRIETNAEHTLSSDDFVTISGVTGTVEANGSWRIAVNDATHFDLVGSVYTHEWVSGGTINHLPLSNITSDANHYGVFWVFVCTEGDIYVVYGQGNYTLANAQTAALPNSLPPYMAFNAVPAAKIIVEPATSNFYSVTSLYTTNVGVTPPTTHNSLSGLNLGDYKHLTAAEYSVIAGAGSITTSSQYNLAQFANSPTGKVLSGRVLHGETYDAGVVVAPQTLLAGRTYTVPDAGANANFAMTEGNQTINGIKYLPSGVKTPSIFPATDSTAAVEIRKADNTTTVVSVDTTNNVLNIKGVGASTITNTDLTMVNAFDTKDDYLQNNLQNLSNGTNATTDYVATADNGNDTTHYVDIGINGSGFTGGSYFPGGWTINGANDSYVYASDGELAIGTTNHAVLKAIRFFTDYPLIANQKGMITGDGKWCNGPFTPTAYLHLRAGSGTAGTAPLKFTSGAVNATPEAGTIEYNGDWYITMANGKRKTTTGTMYIDVSDHTGTGTGETTLATYTLPANTLDVNNEFVEVDSTISITGANNSTIRAYFGATAIWTSNTGNFNGYTLRIKSKIYRTGAATQRAVTSVSESGTAITGLVSYTTPTETLSGTVVIRLTGQNSNDGTRITQRMFEVRHSGAPV